VPEGSLDPPLSREEPASWKRVQSIVRWSMTSFQIILRFDKENRGRENTNVVLKNAPAAIVDRTDVSDR
jgi:hypothetical protein